VVSQSIDPKSKQLSQYCHCQLYSYGHYIDMHTLSMAYRCPPVHHSLAISIGFLIAATPSKTGDRKLRKCEKIMNPENKNIFDNNL
jgi:hypothetical protein